MNTVELEDVTVEAVTDMAVLCVIEGDKYWFPLSQVEEVPDVGATGTLVLARWLAEKEGLA